MWHAMGGGSGETDGGEIADRVYPASNPPAKHLPPESRRSPSRDGSTRRKASLGTLSAGGLAPRARGSRPTVNGEIPVRSKSPKPDP